MAAPLAAGYVGETTVEGFLSRVGSEYPRPCVKEGRRQLWLIDDLNKAIEGSQQAELESAEF